jgi:hypothetical protein
MPGTLGSAHWRARAEEARRDAETLADEMLKHGLRNIAMSYDAMALLAERAERGAAHKKASKFESS